MARQKKKSAVAPPPAQSKKNDICVKTKEVVESPPIVDTPEKSIESKNEAKKDVEPLCGVCGKVVGGDISQHYLATCDVCGKRSSIHSKRNCVNKLWKQTTLGKADDVPHREVPREVFNDQTSVGLYCFHCKVPCFYCPKDKYHIAGKKFKNETIFTAASDLFLTFIDFFLIGHRCICP